MTGQNERSAATGVSRRTVAKGAAWTAPAVIITQAAPALAASPQCLYTVNMATANSTPGTQTYTATNPTTGRVLTFTASSTLNGATGTRVNMTNGSVVNGASTSCGTYSTINSSFQKNGLLLPSTPTVRTRAPRTPLRHRWSTSG